MPQGDPPTRFPRKAARRTEVNDSVQVVQDNLDRMKNHYDGHGPHGSALEWEDVGLESGIGSMPIYAVSGVLTVHNGGLRWYAPMTRSISSIHCSLGTPSSGGGVTVRVKKNGTIIGSVVIASGTNVATFIPASPAFNVGNYFTVDVTTVGGTTPGSDLVVQLR